MKLNRAKALKKEIDSLQVSGGATLVTKSSTNGNVVVNGTELLVYDDTMVRNNIKSLQDASPTAMGIHDLTDVDSSVTPTDSQVLTYDGAKSKWVPKPAPSGGSSGSGVSAYTLELSRWGVSNSATDTADATLATNNSNGINNAMTWAYNQGYAEVCLPVGTYLIHETIPIAPLSFMTLNLCGATLRVRDNKEPNYKIVCFQNNQVFSRITNGKIQGDRYNHDYYYYDTNSPNPAGKAWTKWSPNTSYAVGDKVMPTNVNADNYTVFWKCTTAGASGPTEPVWSESSGSTTSDGGAVWTAVKRNTNEGGYGVCIGSYTPPNGVGSNTRFISVDNIEFLDLTGDGVTLQGTFNQLYVTPNSRLNFDGIWEQGGISSTDGTLVTDSAKIRTTVPITLSQSAITSRGYFGIYGNSYGNVGTGIVVTGYDLFFYKSDGSFLSTLSNIGIFDEVPLPTGATSAKVVLRQSYIPASGECLLMLRAPELPKYSYVDKCSIHDCRRLGLSVTTAKHVYVTNNEIRDIYGTGPQGSIDIEDGYRINQYIYIDKNTLKNCSTGFSIVAGRRIYVTNNKLISNPVTIWGNADFVNFSDNHLFKSDISLWGDIQFANNDVHFSTVTVTDGLSGQTTWAPSHAYAAGAAVVPATANGWYYTCVTAGTSGATEPSWAATPTTTVTDGTAVWRAVRTSRELIVSDSILHNCRLVVDRVSPYKAKFHNVTFLNDAEKYAQSGFSYSVSINTRPQIFQNCKFDGDDYYYLFYILSDTKGGWVFDGVKFMNIAKAFTLVPGNYNSCDIIDNNFGYVTAGVTGITETDYIFTGCKFKLGFTNANVSFLTLNNARSVRMNDCTVQMQDGVAIIIQKVTGDVIIRGCKISYPNPTSTKDVIQAQDAFTGTLIQVEDNIITSTKAPLGFNNQITTNTTATLIVKGNTLVGATLNANGKEIKLQNVVGGVVDPYDQGASANRPTNGNYVNRRYFDTTLGKPIYWNGTGWIDATGTAAP